MEYQLGLWLRNRYGAFIKNVFDPEEVDVISTDLDRTLMSAQCVLAAFYLPDEKTKFRSDLSWMPTPIHTSPKGDDKVCVCVTIIELSILLFAYKFSPKFIYHCDLNSKIICIYLKHSHMYTVYTVYSFDYL